MGLHQCHCDDGVTIPCICVRNRDHDESLFDVPVGQEPTEEEDTED